MCPAPPALSIVAPAYNEAACIEAVVRQWQAVLSDEALEAEIIVVDDGSNDDTAAILQRLSAEFPQLRPLIAPRNEGYGRALSRAIAATRGELVVTIDSDGQFDAGDIGRLLARQRQENLDAVFGHRRRKNDSLARVIADRGLNRLVRLLFGVRFADVNCALKLFRGAWLRAARLDAQGFTAPTELAVRAEHARLRIAEVVVSHRPRHGGSTSLSLLGSSSRMLVALLALRRQLRTRPAR